MPVLPHAFVVMPFGRKPGADGELIDFNRIYGDLIYPALEKAGLEPFRADAEKRGGDIRIDMFQELLLADLVVADLTIDNPNVWYELGVRHALRARGVVHICGGQVPTAFDLYTDRKLRYGLVDGLPDPASLDSDIDALAAMVRDTMESWHGRRISPVYALLPHLQEPAWKNLRIQEQAGWGVPRNGLREFWDSHDAWLQRIEGARRAGHIGNMLVLADEAPVAAFRAEAAFSSGSALRRANRFALALEQLERGLAIEPTHLIGLRQKGICLERLAIAGVPGFSLDRARDHYRKVLEAYPKDAETWALAARVDKDAWEDEWRRPGSSPEEQRQDAADAIDTLTLAMDRYAAGFRADPSHYYSGINALTLMHLARHLSGDPSRNHQMEVMAGAVRFAAEGVEDPAELYWAQASLGDLEVLVGAPDTVKAAYRRAIARSDRDRFALESTRSQLLLLRDLAFRPEAVSAGIEILERAIEHTTPAEERWQPRQVFLFSGHMMDAPDRPQPRFPAAMEPAAAERIAAALDERDAGPEDIAFCQAAAGGDLLFLEACQQRQLRCQVLLPFEEAEFLQRSVLPSLQGEQWRDRYDAMKEMLNRQKPPLPMRLMPVELGPAPAKVNPFERCNLWLLYSALACGSERVRFITLWNGAGGDGPGGTAHLLHEVQRHTGHVCWIDTRSLASG